MADKRVRCAIYTRKSTEEGLEQDFNSLDAQRESCAAYITSQKAEGWIALPDIYDDGGFSGGTLERPALKRLIGSVEAEGIDVIVVYKIDRLSRSLMDFAKLVEVFDRKGVTFVSVTQSFNTTTSMGRLTLNVLLSFAQFEREVIGERIRDKIAASKARGMWMGGNPPLGYDVHERKLVGNPEEAEDVRAIYQCYLEIGCGRLLVDHLKERGILTKRRIFKSGKMVGGTPFTQTGLYAVLNNRLYIGEIVHKGNCYAGQHEAILPRELFDRVQQTLAERGGKKGRKTSPQNALFQGILFDETGVAMIATYSVKHGNIRYRYYVSRLAAKGRRSEASIRRLPAAPFEELVASALRRLSLPIGPRQNSFIQRIDILPKSIKLQLNRNAVFSQWRNLSPPLMSDGQIFQERQNLLEEQERMVSDGDSLLLLLPLQSRLNRRARDGGVPLLPMSALPDKALIKAIAQARRWRSLLLDGEVKSVDELAVRYRLDRSRARFILRLAFLNPTLTRAIANAKQTDLRLNSLLELRPPTLWWEQTANLLGKKGSPL
ncbi:MAG TPA: recombinase family protein [Rhizomicrobium sp.]